MKKYDGRNLWQNLYESPDGEVYDVSEVDDVIEEKDRRIGELEAEVTQKSKALQSIRDGLARNYMGETAISQLQARDIAKVALKGVAV